MDVTGGAPSGGAPSRCGVPIRRPGGPASRRPGVPAVRRPGGPAVRRPGKGREQDAVSFTHRLSEHFYIADFQALGNQEIAHCVVMKLRIQVIVLRHSITPVYAGYSESPKDYNERLLRQPGNPQPR